MRFVSASRRTSKTIECSRGGVTANRPATLLSESPYKGSYRNTTRPLPTRRWQRTYETQINALSSYLLTRRALRFGDSRSELTIDISSRPRSSLRRWTRAREDRLRGGDRVGLLGPGAAELWRQRCSRTTPGSSEIGKQER